MRILGLLFSAFGLCFATNLSGEGPAVPDAPDFSVLTPSIEGDFYVSTQFSLNAVYVFLGSIGDIAHRVRTKQLRRMVASDGYDPTRTLADRLIEVLTEAGYSAVYEPIARRPPGSVQSLAWSDLPEEPKGRLFLDLNVRWLCLCSSTTYMTHYPAISLSWRLLHPGEDVVVPTRNLVYYHLPAWNPDKKPSPQTGDKPVEPPRYPPVEVSESCGFRSLDEAEENPAQVWGCFAEAYDAALRRLVIDLAAIRPPAAPVTASGDSPSGISTR